MTAISQTWQRSPLLYGTLFAVLPLLLGAAVGPLVGFGPCGPNVSSSTRLVVITAGFIALTAPFVAWQLFRISFRDRKAATAFIAFPLLGASVPVCLYWLIILGSAVMG